MEVIKLLGIVFFAWCLLTGPAALWCMLLNAVKSAPDWQYHWWCVPCRLSRVLKKRFK